MRQQNGKQAGNPNIQPLDEEQHKYENQTRIQKNLENAFTPSCHSF
jgi:hypothetical protein